VHDEDDYGEGIIFSEEIPDKERVLEFHVTENNTFKIGQCNMDIWLHAKKKTLYHSDMTFDTDDNEAIILDIPLELHLK
jgi:hypothetical protein